MTRLAVVAFFLSSVLWAAPVPPVQGLPQGLQSYRAGDYRAALTSSEDWLRLHPQDTEAELVAGLASAQLKLWDRAVSYLTSAQLKNPQRQEILDGLLYVYRQTGRASEAKKIYKTQLWLRPTDISLARSYAQFLDELPSTGTLAEVFFNEVHELVQTFPGDPLLNRVMARASRETGRTSLAEHFDRQTSRAATRGKK